MTTKAMPEATAAFAHPSVDRIIRADQFSRDICTRLIAVAAKPIGQINIGQVSPTRNVSDFQKK
jgi:hypothetical protein